MDPRAHRALAACAGMWMNVEIKNSPADPDWDETQSAWPRLTAADLAEAGTRRPLARLVVQSRDHRRGRRPLPGGQRPDG